MSRYIGLSYDTMGYGFTTSPMVGATYFPTAPQVPDTDVHLLDGADIPSVSERCDLVLEGTAAAILAITQLFERAFQDARIRARLGVGKDVFVLFQAGHDDNTYRSRLLNGRLEWDSDPILRMLDSGSVQQVVVHLFWEREGFWEGDTTALSVTTYAGSGTGGLTIQNNNNNYFVVNETDIVGTLPAPVKLQFTNNNGTTMQFKNLYIGHNYQEEPTVHYEAEAGTGGTTTAHPDNSGGNYKAITLTGTMASVWTYTLTSSLIANFKGRLAAILARFHSAPAAGTYVQMRLLASGIEIARGNEVLLSTDWVQVLGHLRLPPLLIGTYAAANLTLGLYARKSGGGTLNLDFVQLFPTDGFRQLSSLATAASTISYANSGAIVDNGLEEAGHSVYYEASSQRQPTFRGVGRPLMLVPDVTNKFWVLFHEQNGSSYITRTLSVKLWYRPRRLTV